MRWLPCALILVILSITSFMFHATTVERWPQGSVITYYNKTGWDLTLDAAARQWNKLHLGVRFKETQDPQSANVIISHSNDMPCEGCVGWVSAKGPQEEPIQMLLEREEGRERRRDLENTYVQTITHEFGHVLGLEHTHNNPCALMNSKERECEQLEVRFERGFVLVPCGPFAADVEQIKSLYPQARLHADFEWCFQENSFAFTG